MQLRKARSALSNQDRDVLLPPDD